MSEPKQPLKNALQEQFAQQKLSTEQLAQLHSLQNRLSAQKKNTAAHPKHYWVTAMAFVGCLAISLLIFFANQSPSSKAYEIAQEAAKNHLKLKPLEITATNIVQVRNYFTELEFQPINSQLLQQLNIESNRALMGGRYCSLKGVSAAQLRYQTPQGLITTFYEVPYDVAIYGPIPDISVGEQPIIVYSKGVKNSLWQEKGLLMVLSESEI